MTEPYFSPEWKRLDAANKLRGAKDITIPTLDYWNYEPCIHHDEPVVGCEFRKCGGDLLAHQRVSMSWQYLRRKGILASATGSGKTASLLSMFAFLKQRDELTGRGLVICQSPAVMQWYAESQRFVPKMRVEVIPPGLTKAARMEIYHRNYDILIMSWQMLTKDAEVVENLQFDVVAIDDVDPALNSETVTAKTLRRICDAATRVTFANATILATKLEQAYQASLYVGGAEVFGSPRQFDRRYVVKEPIKLWDKRKGRVRIQMQTTGYTKVRELRDKLAPMLLRHTYADLTDLRIPDIMPPEEVWLDLLPEQRRRYKELQNGILTILKEQGNSINRIAAEQIFMRGQQICAGLPALPGETRKDSVKLDWIMHKLKGEWSNEKIVVMVRNVDIVGELERRCGEEGIGVAKVYGAGDKDYNREAEIQRFWEDPNCRVIVGTSAMERSLNLQNARIIVFVDLQLNPARVIQSIGRVRRIGSKHDRVFVFMLLIRDSQEERYMSKIEVRQALADFVLDEESEYFENLDPEALLELIGG